MLLGTLHSGTKENFVCGYARRCFVVHHGVVRIVFHTIFCNPYIKTNRQLSYKIADISFLALAPRTALHTEISATFAHIDPPGFQVVQMFSIATFWELLTAVRHISHK